MSPQGSSRRSGSGRKPGTRRERDTPRARAAQRAGDRAARARASSATGGDAAAATDRPAPSSPTPEQVAARPSRKVRGLAVTRRAVAVVVVLFVLLFSYLNSLRVYFRQQQQMAEAQVQIVEHQQAIEKLEDEKARWKDPEYVKAQARSRLGWVVPGEVGYKVIGPDGKPLGAGTELDSESELPEQERLVWWEKMVGSIKAADDPAPTDATRPSQPVRTVGPSSSPSPSR